MVAERTGIMSGRMTRGARGLITALASAGLLFVGPAAAEPSTNEKSLAETLFRAGKTLLAEGHVSEACSKLTESQRLDPGLGTLLNLAVCHEREGKTASAWAEFREVMAVAHRTAQPDREQLATEHFEALET